MIILFALIIKSKELLFLLMFENRASHKTNYTSEEEVEVNTKVVSRLRVKKGTMTCLHVYDKLLIFTSIHNIIDHF